MKRLQQLNNYDMIKDGSTTEGTQLIDPGSGLSYHYINFLFNAIELSKLVNHGLFYIVSTLLKL